jgi:hypothetical protein
VPFCCHGSHIKVVIRLVDTLLHDRCSFFSLSALFPRLVCYLGMGFFPLCNNDSYIHPFGCRGWNFNIFPFLKKLFEYNTSSFYLVMTIE